MNDSITGALPVPITSGPVQLTALSIDLRVGRHSPFQAGWVSLQSSWQRGRILVRRLHRLTDRCEDLSSQLLYRQHCNNRSIMRSQASNWSSAMNSSGLWP
jgi:hypothetical protein